MVDVDGFVWGVAIQRLPLRVHGGAVARCSAPRRYFPDEDPDVERVQAGWEMTDEAHGYCRFCGNQGHAHDVCPNRPALR